LTRGSSAKGIAKARSILSRYARLGACHYFRPQFPSASTPLTCHSICLFTSYKYIVSNLSLPLYLSLPTPWILPAPSTFQSLILFLFTLLAQPRPQHQHKFFPTMALQLLDYRLMLGRTRRSICHLFKALQFQTDPNARPTSMRIFLVPVLNDLELYPSVRNLPKP